jgi:hypothetical protein
VNNVLYQRQRKVKMASHEFEATVIAILKLTSYEIRNISAIAFAVEQQIPVQTVMSKLIIAE